MRIVNYILMKIISKKKEKMGTRTINKPAQDKCTFVQ